MCHVEVEPDGLVFDPTSVQVEEIRTLDEYPGMRVTLLAKVDRAKAHLQVDVGFGDAFPVPPQEVEFPSLLDKPQPILRAYSRETVVAEKLEAIVRFGMLNTRFKDNFDLHDLAQNFEFLGHDLATAIAATFQRRQTPAPGEIPVGLTETFANDPEKIRDWEAFNRRVVRAEAVAARENPARESAGSDVFKGMNGVKERAQQKVTRMKNTNHLHILAALTLLFASAGQGLAQYKAVGGDGIAASPKLRQILNEQKQRKAATSRSSQAETVSFKALGDDGIAASPRVRQTLNEQNQKKAVISDDSPGVSVSYKVVGDDGIAASPRVRKTLNERRPTFQVAPLK